MISNQYFHVQYSFLEIYECKSNPKFPTAGEIPYFRPPFPQPDIFVPKRWRVQLAWTLYIDIPTQNRFHSFSTPLHYGPGFF